MDLAGDRFEDSWWQLQGATLKDEGHNKVTFVKGPVFWKRNQGQVPNYSWRFLWLPVKNLVLSKNKDRRGCRRMMQRLEKVLKRS